MTDLTLRRNWLAAALVLTVFKLWLTRGQGVYAIGSAGHDDRLFVELARHLVRGEWLGPYNELTLAHGPFYSIFIAAVFLLGVPLFLAQQMFYATACALFTRALRPAMAWAGARFTVYTLLLWNPMTFDAPSMGRVLWQQVFGPLGLMIFAGLIALYLRRAEPSRHQSPWVLLLGLAGAAFYLNGGESIWFVPSALLLAGAYLLGSLRISRAAAQRAAGRLGLALVIATIPVLVVCTLNQRHYGRFGTSGLRAAEFQDARDSGQLTTGGARSGLPPPERELQTGPFLHAVSDIADFVVRFSRFSARAPASSGSSAELQLFRDLTRERLASPEGELDPVGPARYTLNTWKVGVLHQTGKALRPVLLGLFCLAQIVGLLRAGWAAWRSQWTFPLAVAAAAWGACAASVLMHARIEVTSFPVRTIASFAPIYPLLLVFIIAVLWDALATWPLAHRSRSGIAPSGNSFGLETTFPGTDGRNAPANSTD